MLTSAEKLTYLVTAYEYSYRFTSPLSIPGHSGEFPWQPYSNPWFIKNVTVLCSLPQVTQVQLGALQDIPRVPKPTTTSIGATTLREALDPKQTWPSLEMKGE